MGKVKNWLMAMEDAAGAAIHDGLGKTEALEYMSTVMAAAGEPTTKDTLEEVYNGVLNPPEDLSP